jgi:hypothetical protein
MHRVLLSAALLSLLAAAPANAEAPPSSLCGPVAIEELSRASFSGSHWRFLGETWRVSGLETRLTLEAEGAVIWREGDPALQPLLQRWEFVEDPSQGRGLFLLGADGARLYAFPNRTIGDNGETRLSGVRYGGDEQAALLPVCPQPTAAAAPPAAAPEAAAPGAIALDTAALTGTAWVIVRDNGSPSTKDLVLDAGGAIGGGAKGGYLERWEVADGALVLWAQGGSKLSIFDHSSVSPGGRPTLTGHPADFPEGSVRMILAQTPEVIAAQLTEEALTGTTWQLRNDDGEVAQERIVLAADGKVEGVPAGDVWIDGWSVADGALVLSKAGRATFKLAFPTEDAQGRRVLNGYLTMNPYQELTLVETGVAP